MERAVADQGQADMEDDVRPVKEVGVRCGW